MPEAKGLYGAISGQWAYWPVSGNRNFRDGMGKLGPRPGVKIAPRLPRVLALSPELGAAAGVPQASEILCAALVGTPSRGPDQGRATAWFFPSG